MAEIINLNKHRKAQAKDIAQRNAQENRARYGRGKAEKERDRLEEERRARLHNGNRMEPESKE